MDLFFLHLSKKKQKDEQGKFSPGAGYEQQHNTAEGSEFLDDAIRMIEQPLMDTEENATKGYIETINLLQ